MRGLSPACINALCSIIKGGICYHLVRDLQGNNRYFFFFDHLHLVLTSYFVLLCSLYKKVRAHSVFKGIYTGKDS